MRSKSSKSFKYGFKLNEQEIRRLHDIVCQQMKGITRDVGFILRYELKFQNGVVSNPNSLDEILTQENVGSSAIRKLGINLGGGGDYSNYKISLQFIDPEKDDSEDNKSIRYTVEGEDRDWVFITSSQIEERIGRLKKIGFSKQFYRIFSLYALQILMLIFLGINFGTNERLERLSVIENQWKSKGNTDLGQLMIEIERSRIEREGFGGFFDGPNVTIIVVFVLIMAFSFVGERIVRFFFPSYNFLWGDYVKTYESRKSMGNFLFSVVLLGIVLSVVSSYIYSYLTGN